MSPLWRDQLRIVLHPDKVVIVRMEKGWRPRVVEKTMLACTPPDAGAAWQGAVDALIQALAQTMKKDPPRMGIVGTAVVVLSNHFVRYTLAPWSDQLAGAEEEQQMLARIRFEQTYGNVAKTWDIRMSDDDYGAPRLASAVDPDLLEALRTAFAATSLRLVSIQPWLMAAYNQWREQMREPDCLLLLSEPGRLCVGQIKNRQWSQVRIAPIGDNLLEELPAFLEREALVSDLDVSLKKYLFAPEQPDLIFPVTVMPALEILKLPAQEGFSPYTDAAYGMALGVEA